MKKLFFVITLFFSVQWTQAQVIIKPETARYFLEAADERDSLRVKDTLQTQIIQSQQKEIAVKSAIIRNHVSQELVLTAEYNNLTDEYNELVDEQNTLVDELDKKDRNTRLRTILEIVGVILLIVVL